MLRLHPAPGESASLKMGRRQATFKALPRDSEVYPGWRTRATESAFHLIGCVLESSGEVLKKSKYLSPTPEQMSQNMEKESDSCIFFPKLLQMI